VTVEDSGTGIDPQNREQVFDALFTTKSNSMGMGRSICRSIVEAHGGRLSVSPSQPHGFGVSGRPAGRLIPKCPSGG
jgi:signal transduction histidine kinase